MAQSLDDIVKHAIFYYVLGSYFTNVVVRVIWFKKTCCHNFCFKILTIFEQKSTAK